MPVQRCGEYLLAHAAAFAFGGPVEAGADPGCRVALDDECAHVRRIAVVMGVERAEFVLDEGLRQGFEALGRPVPDEFPVQMRERGSELALECAAQQRVDAVRRDDQVAIAEIFERADGGAERERHAGGACPLLQELQQLEPADGREPHAVDGDGLAPVHEGDVAPGLHARRDEIDSIGIVLAQELECAVGEHDAETPGRVGRVLFEEADVIGGVPALPQGREIEAARPATQNAYTHGTALVALARLNAGLAP